MNTSALVSVVMPAYNCEKYINKAIDSILNQTYTNFELLIADDASTDNTKSLIDEYTDPRIKRFHNEVNIGYLKASNNLFKKCYGEYITFQDADDFADKYRLEKLKTFLDENSEISCVGSNIIKVDSENQEIHRTKYPLNDNIIRTMFLNYKIVMTGSALMLRKEVIEKCGIYNEYFDRIGSEDTYLYSIILENFMVVNLPDHLYYYRSNPTSIGFTHKNPKATVGHPLVILMYKRRINGLVDFIQSKKWNIVDKYAEFLLSINLVKLSRIKAIFSFTFKFIKYPIVGIQMTRMFISNLKA